MDKLQNNRKIIKGSLTRIFTFASDAEADLIELKVRVEKADDIFKQFENVQAEIEAAANTAEAAATEEAYRVEIENKYFAIKAIYAGRVNDDDANHTIMEQHATNNDMSTAVQTLVEQQSAVTTLLEQMSNSSRFGANSTPAGQAADASQQRQQQSYYEMRLPQVIVPEFDGSSTDWIRFRDLFESMVHNRVNISNVEKLEYLQTRLKKDALSLIKHLQPTNANYEIAWNLLKRKFDKSDKVKRAYLELLFNQPAMKSSCASEIKRVYNNTNESFNALKVLDEPVEQWNTILLFHLEKKLDNDTLSLWYRERKTDECPTFEQFLGFIEKRVFELEHTQKSSNHTTYEHSTQKRNQSRTFTAVVHSCPVCSKEHYLYHCEQFKAMALECKYKVLKKNNICFNCLQPNHQASECKKSSCKLCNAKHNTLLHSSAATKMTSQQRNNMHQQSVEQQTAISNVMSCNNTTQQAQQIFSVLPTAVIFVRDGSNILRPCRALLDSGSQSTLITEACVQRLQLKRSHDKTVLFGVGSGTGSYTKGKAAIYIEASHVSKVVTTEAFCLSELTKNIPGQIIESNKLDLFKSLTLADPAFNKPGRIDMILGVDIFSDCMLEGRIVHPSGSPSALHTIFGWVIMGRIAGTSQQQIITAHVSIDLDKQLQRFWETEELQAPARYFTSEEEEAEQHYQQHVQREENGRYVVKLPLKAGDIQFGDSKTAALKRLYAMERRFENDNWLRKEYTTFMQEFIELDHMENAIESPPNRTFFLPHHAVMKPSSTTTKLRVVFDASCKTTNGLSLNDQLLVGPTIQNDIFNILIKFRKFEIGFIADIEKMYRQVVVHADDRSLQRILWRESKHKQPQQYNLKTVTYGTASAPFLATRTLHQIAKDSKELYPAAAYAIIQNFYVDDFMSCAVNFQSAIQLRVELCKVLSGAGFHLRKWSTNSSQLLETIPLEDRETSTETIIDDTQTVKTLGLQWDTTSDCFIYSVSFAAMPEPVTKRAVLSDISRIFDPLGWMSPVVVSLKIFMQKLWLNGIDWDKQLPDNLFKHWSAFRENINGIKDLQIPRWLNYANEQYVELHGFADSSELAYAATIYLRVQSKDGHISSRLIAAKTRVAPVKQISLPRLELCAAHLMTKLITKVQIALEIADVKLYGWTDSTVVLAWISDHPRRWKSFIANRTSQIINVIPAQQWRHIRSQNNPADLATRGIWPTELVSNELWWSGPDVLRQQQTAVFQQLPIPNDVDMEERKEVTLHVAMSSEIDLINRYSSYNKLLRITAYLRRFLNNCKAQKSGQTKSIGFLTTMELRDSHDALVMVAQRSSYGNDIRSILAGKPLPAKHKLTSLSPFVDAKGLLRVGGRIANANISYDQKHPLILDKNHHLTILIIREYHIRNLHAGNRQLLYLIGLRYWILGVTYAIKRCVYKCTVCMKLRGVPYEQQMGNLPHRRLEPGTAFHNTGVDFAGPIQVRSWKGRGSRLYKCWISLFICLVTKAIHLELVSELSTAAFIATFRRFIARRGKPIHMYSDNGTNFVGASQQLKDLYEYRRTSSVQEKLTKELCDQQIQWHFSPPSGPHFGGTWEAGVKSTKYHLKRVLVNASATFEELYTILCQIESCLNSRPLCSKFEGDTDPLTPAHFLILRSMSTLPEENLFNMKVNNVNRWQYLQRLVQQFWLKWSAEYLTQLQQRPKWAQKLKNLQIDDVVIIKDDNLPPSQWSIGKITATHPGSDELVRVVSVSTSKGIYKRPITKLCPLFLDI